MGDWTAMAQYGGDHGLLLIHWLMLAIAALVLYPTSRVLACLGLSPFWSILAILPIITIVSLWVLAFIDWPGQGQRTLR